MLTAVYILVGLYIIACLLFYFGQHLFFFRPEILPDQFDYDYDFPFRERTFIMSDGGSVNAIHFEVPNSKGIVFYMKGNSRSIKGWGKFAKDFLGKGYDFFMMDYRGFGKSRGKRSEKLLHEDTLEVLDAVTAEYDLNRIVVYGRSFGSGIAAWLCSKRELALLILDSPYYSFSRQISRFLGWLPLRFILKYKIPTYKYLQQVNIRVVIIHGNRDYIISYRQGAELAALVGAELVTIDGGRHNNLSELSQYHEELYRILN